MASVTEERGRRFSKSKSSWISISYKTRVTIFFGLIAVLTVVIATGVISIVWGQYFQSYTSENVEAIATTTANRIATRIVERGKLDDYALQPAQQTAEVTPEVSVKVLNAQGNTVYDSSARQDETTGELVSSEPTSVEQIALKNIVVDGVVQGSVRIWTNGSDALMNKLDIRFRNNSYQALLIAALVAVAISTAIGYLFARSIVRPINQLVETAEKVRDGDFEARAEVQGDGEFALLGETFDSMVDALERDRELERRLVSDVAHELRTPLMSIQATVEAMVDGVYEADKEHLNRVDSEVQRLSRLVDALLKLSRLENRSQSLKLSEIDLGEFVREIVRTHEVFVSEEGLTISFAAMPDVKVEGDADMLGQAIVNLVSNAVRYTPEGGRIDVIVGRGPAQAYIAVTDTGIGLTRDEQRMVWSRFWRADEARTRTSGGLGVGLAVVKEIIDQHRGQVHVQSEKGKGTTFTIYLPLMSSKDEERDRKHRDSDSHRDKRRKKH